MVQSKCKVLTKRATRWSTLDLILRCWVWSKANLGVTVLKVESWSGSSTGSPLEMLIRVNWFFSRIWSESWSRMLRRILIVIVIQSSTRVSVRCHPKYGQNKIWDRIRNFYTKAYLFQDRIWDLTQNQMFSRLNLKLV